MQRDATWSPPWPAWIDTLALATVALAVAAPSLGTPDALVFDEVFYVSDAVSHLEVGVGRGFQAHPPLGTWLIAAGIGLLGRSPAAWRAVPLAMGVLTVAVLHRLALRLLPDGALHRLLAASVALLLVLDGSWFVLSRTAMLDGPLTAIVLATVTAAVVAADRARPRPDGRWVVIAGALGGAATAVKWSGVLGLGLALLVLALARPQQGGATRLDWRTVTALLGTAAAVYAAAWVPFAVNRADVPVASCPAEASPCVQEGGLAGVVAQHAALARYHADVQFSGGYESEPSWWPLSVRPVTLYRASCDVPRSPMEDPFANEGSCPPGAVDDDDPLTYAGNPAVWLLFVLLLPLLAGAARTGDRAARVALAGWALQWLPWLVVTRSSFLYYMAPAVPFMALGAIVAANVIPSVRPVRVLLPAGLGAVGAAVVSLLPGVPTGVVLLGWIAGGAAGVRLGRPLLHAAGRVRAWITGLVLGAATITFLAMLPTWTVTG